MEKCIHCNATVFNSPFTAYCMECGKLLDFNTCVNSECIINVQNTELPETARYCPACGKETAYSPKVPFCCT